MTVVNRPPKGQGGKVTGSLGDPTRQVKKTRESIYANKVSLGTGEKEKAFEREMTRKKRHNC